MKPISKKLRLRAEKFSATARREVAQMPVDDVQKLVHGLQVHEVELKMQNEELRRTQLELETARNRYVNLFDFAPVAQLTLKADGEILEANLAAGELLGLERSRLIHQKFSRFVMPLAQDTFYLLCQRVFNSKDRQSEELDLRSAQAKRVSVLVDVVREEANPEKQCRLCLTDITQRKQAEAALDTSRSLNQVVMNSMTSHIAVLDRQGNIITANEPWNRFAQENAGVSCAQSGLKANYLEVCRRAVAARETGAVEILAGIQAVLDGSQNFYSTEYPCHSPTQERWFIMTVNPLAGAGGGAVITHTDITHRKLMEVALQEKERLLQSVMDLVPHFIFVKDIQSRFLLVNRACAAAHGLTPEQMVGRCDLDLLPNMTQAKAFIQGDREVITSGKQKLTGEEPLTNAAGQTRILQTIKIPFALPGGEPALMGVSVDITDLKWTEDVLRKSERSLRLLNRALEQSPASVLITSATGVIEYVNPKFTETTGYTPKEVLGNNPRILKSGQQSPAFYKELWETITAGRDWRGEFCNRKKNGELFWEFAVIAPILDEYGTITQFVALKEDITERRRLTAELLEVADREQQRIGHDLHDGLGQQLTALEFKSFLLAEDIAADKRVGDWTKLKKKAREISMELRECIAVTRSISQGLAPVVLKTRGLVGALEQLARRTNIPGKLSCRFTCRSPVNIENLQTGKQLYRIAQEAVSNALKHARSRNIRISLSYGDDLLSLKIKDDGKGLPNRRRSVSGMGLDAMRHRAHVIGATLKIDAKPGKGVSVTCTLPL